MKSKKRFACPVHGASKTLKNKQVKIYHDLRQSPVNIQTKRNIKLRSNSYFKIEYINKLVKAKKHGVGSKNIHFTPINKSLFVIFNNHKFKLIQYHFHKPSEHSFQQKKTDMEVHLVHKNVKSDNYLVVSFMINKGRKRGILDDGIDMKNNAEFKIKKKDVAGCLYTYPGSLTTPPFTSNVRWVIFKKALQSRKITKWDKKYGKPLRPPQRTISSEVTQICDK